MLFFDRSKVSKLNEGVFKCTLFFANVYYYKKKGKRIKLIINLMNNKTAFKMSNAACF